MIKIYSALTSGHKPRECIFRRSCINHVYRETYGKGIIAGLKAWEYRNKNCRPGFSVFENPINGELNMLLPNDEIIEEDKMARHLIKNYEKRLETGT